MQVPRLFRNLIEAFRGSGRDGERLSSTALKALFCVALLVPILLFSAMTVNAYIDGRKRDRDVAQDTLSVLAEHAAKVFEVQRLVLDRTDDLIRNLSWAGIASSRDLHLQLRRMVEDQPQVDTLWITDRDGINRNSSRFFPLSQDASRRDYFLAQRTRDQGFYVGASYFGPLTQRQQFSISRRVPRADGTFDGTVSVSLSPAYFDEFYARLADDRPGASVALVRMDGEILARYPRGTGGMARDMALAEHARDADTGTYPAASAADGVPRIYAYRRVRGYPVYVVYGTSEAEITASWLTAVERFAAIVIPAFAALLLLGRLAVVRAARAAEVHAALVASENRYRTLYDTTPTPLGIMGEDETILDVNACWEATLGYERADAIGRRLVEFVAPEVVEDHRRGWARIISEGSVTDVPCRYVARNGSIVEVVVSAAVERDPAGRVVRVVVSAVDVTHKIRAEKALRHGQKMEALGKLTGGVAHDFNNLLSVIVGNAELSKRRVPAESRVTAYMDSILTASARGTALTRQLLSFSRTRAMEAKPVDLADDLPRILAMIKPSIRGDIALSCSVQPGLWQVEVDPAEFEIALINVSVNARDAMPRGGRFSLAATNVTISKGDLADAPDMSGEFVEILMSDDGTGMTAEVASRAFEPFYTTKEVGKGTGLGLSQVYGFANQSGGVSLLRTGADGTTVVLLLPRTLNTAAVADDEARPAATDTGGKRILLVDDNLEVGKVTADVLSGVGYDVEFVECAAAALASLADGGGNVDLVLSDIVMPGGMNGIELGREIRRRHPGLPVVLVSGYSEQEMAGGEFVRLSKPVRLAELLSTVAQAIDKPASPD